MAKAAGLQYVGVREFKEVLTGFLGKKGAVVVTRRGKAVCGRLGSSSTRTS